MANGVIEQLLDFNQGNLYPKITNVNASYISETDVNGAAGFIKDLFAAGALDASTFEISGNKLSLKSDAVIPGTIANASSADKVKHELKIQTAENKTEIYNGSEVVNITKVYQADKLTKDFKIRVPDASNNTPTYRIVGTDRVDIDKVYSAVYADRLFNDFKIKVLDTNGTSYRKASINSSTGEDIDTVWESYSARTADKVANSLKIAYTDKDSSTRELEWNGSVAGNITISSIQESQYAKQIKDLSGSDTKIASIMTVSGASDTAGQISRITNPVMTSDRVVLCINRSGNSDNYSYSYEWVDGTQIGGAQVDQANPNTPYYVLGASDKEQTTIYGNFSGKSPYFKNSNLYQTSDETLKTFTEDLDVNLDNLASIKKGLFYWNSDENKVLDIGVTAQSLEPLFPELVTETDGIKAVSYSKLSVVALAAIDKLYKRVKELEDEVEELKSK